MVSTIAERSDKVRCESCGFEAVIEYTDPPRHVSAVCLKDNANMDYHYSDYPELVGKLSCPVCKHEIEICWD